MKDVQTTMGEVVDILSKRADLTATLEYPGFICIPITPSSPLPLELNIGTVNATWSADLMEDDSCVEDFDGEMYILSDCPDPEIIAAAISILIERARKYAKV